MGQICCYLTTNSPVDFKIPQGSRITDIILEPLISNPRGGQSQWTFIFGYGVYAAASIVAATNKMYLFKRMVIGWQATAGNPQVRNTPVELELTGLNITSVDNDAFVILIVDYEDAAVNPDGWLIITWDESTLRLNDFKNRPSGVFRGVKGIDLSPQRSN